MVLADEVIDSGWGRADETFTIAKMQHRQKGDRHTLPAGAACRADQNSGLTLCY
jgi:hypothetical protein